jgi:dihydropyrimidinase/dihydroorotase
MIAETVIRNGLVVLPDSIFPGGVAVDKGVIVAVTTDAALPEATEVIDAKGCYITPGFIDAHTHQGLVYDFGIDVRGQSMLAAQGGVTLEIGIDKTTKMRPERNVDTLTAQDVPSYAEVYDWAAEEISKNAYVDMAFTFPVMTDAHVGEIEYAVRELGITSFKFYMQLAGTADRWSARNGFPMTGGADLGTMYLAFEQIGRIGRPAMALIHAENRFLERVLRVRFMERGGNDLATWAQVCSPLVEQLSIREAAFLALHTRAPLYVVHLSAADALYDINRARDEGVDFTVEVNTPWLCTTTEDDPPGIYGKFLPPLRDRDNMERLWEGLRNGTIQCMGTDDATVSRRWKETRTQEVADADRRAGTLSAYAPTQRKPGEPHNIWTVGNASSGVETYVPALMTQGVAAGRISMQRLVQVACENNAKAFALYPRKGTLRIGSDADINIIDPTLRRRVEPQPLPQDPSTEIYSFWEGRELVGWPTLTMVRGRVVCRHGEIVGEPGYGKLIERKNYPRPYSWWPH